MIRRELVVRLAALTAFAVAFGYVEGAVVVYLRELAYPEGFRFPLVPFPDRVIVTEVLREAATIVLLLGSAFACERRGYRRFAVFAFTFGIWDAAYYGTLRAVLGWPKGWLEWDVLFLIPAVWTGPVLAPILVSAALVAASLLLLSLPPDTPSPLALHDWLVEIGAGSLILLSFLWNAEEVAVGGSPGAYPWWLFGLGYAGGILWFGRAWLGRPLPRVRVGSGERRTAADSLQKRAEVRESVTRPPR